MSSKTVPPTLSEEIAAYWSRHDALGWIQERLKARGITEPTYEEVGRLDQIHAGGLQAVRELAALVSPQRNDSIVDVGGGLGGAARYLAGHYGARVVSVELTPSLVQAGEALSRWVGLGEEITHLQGDATQLEGPPSSFDGAWLQHILLQLPDKPRFWSRLLPLLRPGAWIALHEWVCAPGGVPLYPCPWTPASGDLSFLEEQKTLCQQMEEAGLCQIDLRDVSTQMAQGYRRQLQRLQQAPSPSNPIFPAEELLPILQNAEQNLREGRTLCLMGTARLPT